MANYILSDGPDIGAFIAGLEETSRMKWQLLWREGHANVAKWRRIVNYFVFPLRFYSATDTLGTWWHGNSFTASPQLSTTACFHSTATCASQS